MNSHTPSRLQVLQQEKGPGLPMNLPEQPTGWLLFTPCWFGAESPIISGDPATKPRRQGHQPTFLFTQFLRSSFSLSLSFSLVIPRLFDCIDCLHYLNNG